MIQHSAALGWIKSQAYSLLSAGFGIAAIAMILGATLVPSGQISGESLVVIEVQVLPGFYMKPITFFQFSLFLAFAFGLYSPQMREIFLTMNSSILRAVYIIAWLIAMGSAFEVVYSIVIWSAALAIQGLSNPDIVVNIFPISVNPAPINVVFASKIIVAIFFMSIFLIDYVHRIDRVRRERLLTERLTRAR